MASPTLSATHRGLLLDEVFRCITSHLDSDLVEKRTTLARLARTCRALNEAAILILWKRLDSIVPLLRLLPPAAWSERQVTRGRRVFRITDSSQLGWTRFRHYARHVRELSWNLWPFLSELGSDVEHATFSILCTHRPTLVPLLPELGSLSWDDRRPAYLGFIRLFFTPTLRTLRLAAAAFDRQPRAAVAMYRLVAQFCTQIERFDVYPDRVDGSPLACSREDGDALAQSLRTTQNLTSFCMPMYLTASCVEALAVLPKLAVLEFWIRPGDMTTVATLAARSSTAGTPWFATLDTVLLNVERMDDDTMAFLRTLQSLNVKKISMTVLGDDRPETYTVLRHTGAIASAPYRDCLEYLEIKFECNVPVAPPVPLNVNSLLRPLYQLSQIRAFTIEGPSIAVDAPALQSIANAWSQLKELAFIHTGSQPPFENCLTLRDLAPLARMCPDLLSLALQLDATEVPEAADMAQLLPQPSRARLRRLWILDAPISHPQLVASFLQRLFPELHQVDYGEITSFPDDAQDTFERHWDMVQAIILDNKYASGNAIGPGQEQA
ncbi:hypothetical protein BV20DRAFT_953207 [Pilatotrama ljubarskyi]|nr:hypothetical protein BV20DRAFT_953207 [Pilatotrama ljubarskyi]